MLKRQLFPAKLLEIGRERRAQQASRFADNNDVVQCECASGKDPGDMVGFTARERITLSTNVATSGVHAVGHGNMVLAMASYWKQQGKTMSAIAASLEFRTLHGSRI